jgi:hypothetical protein
MGLHGTAVDTMTWRIPRMIINWSGGKGNAIASSVEPVFLDYDQTSKKSRFSVSPLFNSSSR